MQYDPFLNMNKIHSYFLTVGDNVGMTCNICNGKSIMIIGKHFSRK